MFGFLFLFFSITAFAIESGVPATVTVNPVWTGTLRVTPTTISVINYAGTTTRQKLTFFQESGTEDLNVTLTKDGAISSWISFNKNSFIVKPTRTTRINVSVIIPKYTPPETYTGNIFATTNRGQVIVIPVTVNVVLKVSLKVKVTIPTEIVAPGQDVNALIEVWKTGEAGTIEVKLSNGIKKRTTFFASKRVSVPVIDYSRTIETIRVPANALEGRYKWSALATYDIARAKGSDSFSVVIGIMQNIAEETIDSLYYAVDDFLVGV